MLPAWIAELFCPAHGLPVLLTALCRYWGLWRVGMAVHVRDMKRVVGFFRGT